MLYYSVFYPSFILVLFSPFSLLSLCACRLGWFVSVTFKVWWPQEERRPTRNSSHKRETERERERDSWCFRNMHPILYIALTLKSKTQLCVKSGKPRPWFTQTPPRTRLDSGPKWGHAANAFLFVCVYNISIFLFFVQRYCLLNLVWFPVVWVLTICVSVNVGMCLNHTLVWNTLSWEKVSHPCQLI